MKVLAHGGRGAREIRIENDVVDPHGLAGCPDAPGKPLAAAERHLAADAVEFRKIGGRGAPRIHAPKHVGFAIDAPERTKFPAKSLADGLENLRRRIAKGCRLDQRARRDMLGREAPLRMDVHANPWKL